MAAVGQDITLWAGDDLALDMTIYEEDGVTVLDLTNSAVEWVLTSIYDRATILVRKSSQATAEIDITDAVAGLVTIYVADADTAHLGGQPYYHEVRVIDLSRNTVVTVATGTVTIEKTALALQSS